MLVPKLLVALVSLAPPQAESLAPPDDPRAAHELAVTAYRSGDLDSAEALWLAALDSSRVRPGAVERSVLLYDLGNLAYRRDHPLEAVGWYTAAIGLAPRYTDAWVNLEFVRGEAGLEPADRGDLASTWQRLLSFLTLAESEQVLLASAVLLAAALAFEALRGGALARRLALAALGLVVLALVPWIANLRAAGRDPLLVVSSAGVTLHSEPRREAKVVGRVEAGESVERVDRVPEWERVELDDGTRGWVSAPAVFELRR